MHTIDISEEGLSHLPEGLREFTDLDENNHIWATDGAISIGTNWDYDSMNEDFIYQLEKFQVVSILRKVLKFCKPFKFVYGGCGEETFYEYLHFDGKKLIVVSGATLCLDEENEEANFDMDYDIRQNGEATPEFLDIINEKIDQNSSDVSFYDLDGNKIKE